jgi:GTP-binding protein
MPLTIAILGRPNVGKSTLFNRLAGRRLALVDDTPGVTRDRREAAGSLGDLSFRIIDTAGLEEGDEASLFGRMRLQTDMALDDADVVFMLIDARAGITPLDRHFSDWLRRQDKPVILVVNKCEGRAGGDGLYESYSLGLGDPVPISAEHGEGLADLYTELLAATEKLGLVADGTGEETAGAEDLAAPDSDLEIIEGNLEYQFEDDPDADEKPLQLAIVGRPNVGKSTLINQLIGENRLVTGPEAGLTRDSISVDWSWKGRAVRLFDTAGLRRKAKVVDRLERMSVEDTLRAIRFANVVILVIDAVQGIEKQDLRIANMVADEGRALILVPNKWDIIEDRLGCMRKMRDDLTRSLPNLKEIEVVPLSALTGQGTKKLLPAVGRAYELWNSRVGTAALNRWLANVTEQHPPPMANGKRVRIRFMAQIKTRPPTFTLFCNRPANLAASYLRYMENEMRRVFRLPGTPLRFLLRAGKNPYEGKRKTRKDRTGKTSKKKARATLRRRRGSA